jgi:hypothetical protein
VACTAAKFNILDGLGECYWTPYFHKDQRPVWNLVFEAKPGTAFDRFQGARSGDDVLRICKQLTREMLPWDARWLESATLADENSWLIGAIAPTVRDPVTVMRGPVIPLGDAYAAFDPLGAQGANIGNRLAKTLVAAIVERGDRPFDAGWVRSVYDPFYDREVGPSMRWTHLLLEPIRPPARYYLLAQNGSDGSTLGGTPKQQLADAFANNFDDPSTLVEVLRDFSKSRRYVASVLGKRGDWEAAKGLVTVGGRQLRNTLSP